jgi:hypothetical protein
MRGRIVRRKHLLYLASERLDAWLWEGGKLSGPASFSADYAGVEAFKDYLELHGATPAWMLADLVEEDFQRVLLPHVQGKAGRALLERRLLQLYRETSYRQATVQDRSEEGRRDDIVLFSALTNPQLPQPWIAALEQLKVPLAGVYSVALLGASLVDQLELREHKHLLLVTQQSAGLRQSYFCDGRLKFSRLTLAVDREGQAADVGTETARTQQFLVSVRLMERGEVLHAVLVAPPEDMDRWYAQCVGTPETAYHFLPIAQAAARAGLPQTPTLADALYLHRLASRKPASHFPLGREGRYFRFWQTRRTLYASSAMLAAAGAVWAGATLWEDMNARAEGARLSAEAQHFDASYRVRMSDMPPALAPTADMRAAVTVQRLLSVQGPRPTDMMGLLGDALDKVPQISLLRLEWRVNPAGAAGTAGKASANVLAAMPGRLAEPATPDQSEVEPIPSSLLGIPGRPAESLRLEAEVHLARNDYRAVMDSMNRFALELAHDRRLTVEIERPALDVRPGVKLSGRTGASAGDKPAQFVLNLVLKP